MRSQILIDWYVGGNSPCCGKKTVFLILITNIYFFNTPYTVLISKVLCTYTKRLAQLHRKCIFRPRPKCTLKSEPIGIRDGIKIIVWTPACELMLQWYIRVLKVTWKKKTVLYDILPFSCLTFYVFNKLEFSFKHSKTFLFASFHYFPTFLLQKISVSI